MRLQFLQVCHWKGLLPLMRMLSHSSHRIEDGLLYCDAGRSSFSTKTLAAIKLLGLLSFLGFF